MNLEKLKTKHNYLDHRITDLTQIEQVNLDLNRESYKHLKLWIQDLDLEQKRSYETENLPTKRSYGMENLPT